MQRGGNAAMHDKHVTYLGADEAIVCGLAGTCMAEEPDEGHGEDDQRADRGGKELLAQHDAKCLHLRVSSTRDPITRTTFSREIPALPNIGRCRPNPEANPGNRSRGS